MKFLFASVPQWYPVSPYLAGALLVGQLKNAGYDAHYYDFNIDFFNDILTKENVSNSYNKAKEILASDSFTVDVDCSEDIREKLIKSFQIRYTEISKYLHQNSESVKNAIDGIDDAVRVFKTKERFYDPEQLYMAKDTITTALDIVSLPYLPSRIMLDNYIADPVFTYDF